MLTVANALDRLQSAISAARAQGADAADGLYVGEASTSVQVRLGALEDIGRSEGEELALRVFVGSRSASVSTSDLGAGALAELVDRAVAMAREAPEDPYAGLAPADRLAPGPFPDLDLDDGGEVDPTMLREAALAAEDAARAVPGIANSEGGSASAGRGTVAIATSHGFAGGYTGSNHGLWAVVIAGEGAAMQRDYASHSARHRTDLEAADAIGRRAGERAVRRLNPARLTSGTMPVVFDPRVGNSLIGHLAGAITGSAIARKTSFLLGKRDERVFAPGIVIVDDPHRPRGLRSRGFDGEGLATRRTEIVADGVLGDWLMDSASARQLGEQPTGHATRGIGGPPGAGLSNVYLAAGDQSAADLIADIGEGLLVTELIGHGVNPVTGDYSRGAAGFVIRDGVIGGAVAEVTIAGNLVEMFAAMRPANDLEFRRTVDVPTIRIDGMMVGGA